MRKRTLATFAACKLVVFVVCLQAALLSPFGAMFGVYTLLAAFCAAIILY